MLKRPPDLAHQPAQEMCLIPGDTPTQAGARYARLRPGRPPAKGLRPSALPALQHALTPVLTALAVALAAVALPFAREALAEPPVTVRASVDRDHVTVGDRVTLTIVVEHDEGLTPAAPEATSAFGLFEVLAVERPRERSLGGGRKETVLVFTVAVFRTGDLEVPPLAIPYRDAAGNPATATAPAIPITVASVIPAGQSPTDVRDLKPQLGVPGAAPAYLRLALAAGAAVAAAAAVGLVLLLSRALRRRPAPSPPIPPLSPEDEARAELERIAALGLPGREAPKEHYRLLGGCIRRYLTARYGFPALALTTAELEEQMVDQGVDRWQARLVSGLLQECDDVRYGQYVPAAARADADLTAAFEIVEMTRPQPEEEREAETLEARP